MTLARWGITDDYLRGLSPAERAEYDQADAEFQAAAVASGVRSFRACTRSGMISKPAHAFRQALAAELRARVGVAQSNPVFLSRATEDMSAAIIRRGLAAERDFSLYEVLQLAQALKVPYTDLIEAADRRMTEIKRAQDDIEARTRKEIG